MKKIGILSLIITSLVTASASADVKKLDSSSVDLLNGVLNGRWADDPEMQSCLKEFKGLHADVVSAQAIAPVKDEGSWLYRLEAEKYVTGGKETFKLEIEHFEGGYACKIKRR